MQSVGEDERPDKLCDANIRDTTNLPLSEVLSGSSISTGSPGQHKGSSNELTGRNANVDFFGLLARDFTPTWKQCFLIITESTKTRMSDKLHKYCHDGSYKKVKNQLEEMERKGVDVPTKLSQKLGVFGYTPLHDAATEGHHKVLQLLIQYRGCVNSKASSGYTPLHLAASAGHVECVRVLVEEGNADINEKDDYRQSPLQSAERSARSDVVRVLRSAGKSEDPAIVVCYLASLAHSQPLFPIASCRERRRSGKLRGLGRWH